MGYFLAGVVLLVLLVLGARAFAAANPASLARGLRSLAAYTLLALAAAFALTGRFMLSLPLAGVALMILAQNRARARATPSPGGRSQVRTAWLAMELDHESGELDGAILQGQHAGRWLGTLDEVEMAELIAELDGDGESLQLVEVFLDRMRPGWRTGGQGEAGDGASGSGKGSAGGAAPRPATGMTEAEAWMILGLQPGASIDEIRSAHRKLMKAVHPDHGGSNYLASRINAAKDMLVARAGG
ncbi:MAG: DnaJ domain-containing protein [Rhizobiales bacterium]|nr:DnaJ domain-containing protein [Hyphomicrobiales bacterium]